MEERGRIDIPDLSNLNVEFFLSSNPDQIFINHELTIRQFFSRKLYCNFFVPNSKSKFRIKQKKNR